ncbi:uncharacterized protein LOC142475793, partial [Ascaphus truei]|uniref:uncharacterized protein LOC142475793 n=1 Tax=Ascaphus truei TaxID=8439 RepID=UPI003F5A1F4C
IEELICEEEPKITPKRIPFRVRKAWKEEDSDEEEARNSASQAWEEEDSDEEESRNRALEVSGRTKVVPFVLEDDDADDEADDESDDEADDEADNEAGCKAGNEAGYETGYEADSETDSEADSEAHSEADSEADSEVDSETESETDFKADDKWGDEVDNNEGEYERCGGMCCFPFHRFGRRSRGQVAEGPGHRNRGILGALRSWFNSRRGR